MQIDRIYNEQFSEDTRMTEPVECVSTKPAAILTKDGDQMSC